MTNDLCCIIRALTCWDKRVAAAFAWVVIDWRPRVQLQFFLKTKMTSITVCQLHQSSSIIVRLFDEYWHYVSMNASVADFLMQRGIEGCRFKKAVWRIAMDVLNLKIYVLVLYAVQSVGYWLFRDDEWEMPVSFTSLSVGTWHEPSSYCL